MVSKPTGEETPGIEREWVRVSSVPVVITVLRHLHLLTRWEASTTRDLTGLYL